ncbi:MAG: sodium/proline symporter [Deltaproteobacteria bacterium]|nr:MAG: sodium/proline symporter [Deltaproteobacteria bacterium]
MVWIFAGYLMLTLGLGLWKARSTRTQADFVLGSSRIAGWALALSERATGESAWLLLGFSGYVYAHGLSAIWIGVGCLAGISTAWLALAGRFRAEAARTESMTMPEYFAARFPEKAAAIRLLSTLIIVFFFVFYVGAQFAGAGKTIFQTFGLDQRWSQVAAALVIMIYATMGGFVSVVAVDVLQSILMITTLIVAPAVMLVMAAGEPATMGQALGSAGAGMDSFTGTAGGFAAGLLIFNHFSWFFGYLGGQPQLNARFMGMRDERNVRIGRNIAIGWTVVAYSGVVILGLSALVLFGPNAVEDPEMILPHALMKLFPWWLAAILLAGAVAAMISTAQSMLLVAASSLSQDVYAGIVKKGKAEQQRVLLVSRIATLAVGVLGLVLALTTKDLIYTIVSYAWAGIGCSFAPAVLLCFFWKRFSGPGLVAALVAGILTTVLWMSWPHIMNIIGAPGLAVNLEGTVTARAVTFFVSMAAAIITTLLSETTSRDNR